MKDEGRMKRSFADVQTDGQTDISSKKYQPQILQLHGLWRTKALVWMFISGPHWVLNLGSK